MLDLKTLQLGDILLFQGKSFISRGIMYFTKSKYSHAALYIGGGENYIIEATGAGVEKNLVAPLIAQADAFCVRRIPDLTVENAELMKDKAYSLIYSSYDTKQLLSLGVYYTLRKLGLNWDWLVSNNPQRITCSELVAVACLCIPLKFAAKVKDVTPETLYLSNKLVTVVESYTKE